MSLPGQQRYVKVLVSRIITLRSCKALGTSTYSGGAWFEFRLGHRLSLLMSSMAFLTPFTQVQGIIFRLGKECFLSNSSDILPFDAIKLGAMKLDRQIDR